jgi:hypothetical protein
MPWVLAAHITAGSLALAAGFMALYASKGARLHRQSGRVFTYAMFAMTACGVLLAMARDAAPAINVPAGVLTAYMVGTGLATVRPPAEGWRWLHPAAMLLALALGLACLAMGFQALAHGGSYDGMPAFPYFLLGIFGLLGAAGDWRVLRSGPPQGALRIARHLWRMSFALWVATSSFFLGQAKVIPQPLRIPGLLALPVLAVLLTLLYWLWRVRVRKNLAGVTITCNPAGKSAISSHTARAGGRPAPTVAP